MEWLEMVLTGLGVIVGVLWYEIKSHRKEERANLSELAEFRGEFRAEMKNINQRLDRAENQTK